MNTSDRCRFGLYRLGPNDRAQFVDHLLLLDAPARRRRFGVALGDDAVRAIAKTMAFDELCWGLFVGGALKGTAMVLRSDARSRRGEFAISLDADLRGVGWGRLLLNTALESAYQHGVEFVDIHYLAENAPMARLCAALPGSLQAEHGERSKEVQLQPWAEAFFWQDRPTAQA